jgi:electron transport complex protein RnfB
VTALGARLKGMARAGLIKGGRTKRGMGYGLLPFVVGIYEMQASTLDAELARLFEDYYQEAFGRGMSIRPPVHRVVPVAGTVRVGMEIHPYESAAGIVAANQAWGVVDCICRKQKALIGEPCGHPVDVCMVLSPVPGAFEGSTTVRALSEAEALATLRRAADAGLVHSVSNSREGAWYICNCCTCSCGILRGLAELGLANVIARSAFVNQVDEDACGGCGLCVDLCQFAALRLDQIVRVDALRCAGCGVCVPACPENALRLVRRPEDDVLKIPATEAEWQAERAAARGLDLTKVL